MKNIFAIIRIEMWLIIIDIDFISNLFDYQ
jgi:hypothetical protein